MVLKCKQPEKLAANLASRNRVLLEEPTSGKYVVRIQDVVCNIYSTGSVVLQGRVNTQVQQEIVREIELLNA